MNVALRILIVAVAGFLIWKFSDGLSLAWNSLTSPGERWFNVLSDLCEGAFGPALALSAIALAIMNRRLLLAAFLAGFAGVVYIAPIAAFLVGIMIYGF
jgi:hypothetical protein